MDVLIGENLKKFRKHKGSTQEDLATHLGLSVQAVSKWERGEGCPDISFLPDIAAFYGTTVDDLLGCGQREREKRLNFIKSQYSANQNVGKIEENIVLMREALHEFPENTDVKCDLMFALSFCDKLQYLDDVISLGEEILQENVDDNQRNLTIQNLAYAYNKKNMPDKAREYARRLPEPYCTKNSVLQAILKGDELRRLTQTNIGNAIGSIDNSVIWMLRSRAYTPKEKILAYETVDKLYKLIFYDGNFGYEHSALFILWSHIAREYAGLHNVEKTLEALETMRQHATAMDDLKDARYTTLFADMGTYFKKGFVKNFEFGYREWLRKIMAESEFDFLRQKAAFSRLLQTASE